MVTTLKHPKFVIDKVNWATLGENDVLVVNKMTKRPFPSVVTSSKHLLQEETNLPMVHTSDGFNLDIYKLMKESGYDFRKPPSPGYVINAKPYGSNSVQKTVQE